MSSEIRHRTIRGESNKSNSNENDRLLSKSEDTSNRLRGTLNENQTTTHRRRYDGSEV